MAVKITIHLVIALILCSLLVPGIVLAQTARLSLVFEGDVTIDGYDAPLGTVIVAEVEGVEAASNAPDGGITESGKYMLVIPNENYTGKMVVLKVDNIVAGEHIYVSSMDPIVNFDLHALTFAPAGAIDNSPGSDNGNSGGVDAFLAEILGLGTKTLVGIVAGVVALVILLIAVIRHRRIYM